MNVIIGEDIVGTSALLVLFGLLSTAIATDFSSHRIPNLLLLPALSLALMLHTLTGGIDGLITAGGGLALGLAMLMPLYVTGGMGAGDVKLLGVVGSFLGPWGAVVAGLATMMAGAILGVVYILWQRVWPALELYATQLLSPHTGANRPAIPHAGRSTTQTKIPYAPAIAAGTMAALWYIGAWPIN
ncbi:MAG: prepilin peptidase [Gammaproteobacteria bacterium]|nr:prepilin peptidase [Gammaproteobacteria bacterium]